MARNQVVYGWRGVGLMSLTLMVILLAACMNNKSAELVPTLPSTVIPLDISPPVLTQTPTTANILPTTHVLPNTWTPQPSSTPRATTIPPSNTLNETRYINTTHAMVNLRSGPGVSFDVVGSLANGSEINVIGKQTTSDGFLWYEFVYGSRSAWIYGELTSGTPLFGQGLALPPPLPAPGFCTCGGQDLDCSNFNGREAAQACYNKCMAQVGSDVYHLDGDDNDGRVCER